jgi:hypothetical protein
MGREDLRRAGLSIRSAAHTMACRTTDDTRPKGESARPRGRDPWLQQAAVLGRALYVPAPHWCITWYQ